MILITQAMQLGFVKSGTSNSTHSLKKNGQGEVYRNIPVHHSETRTECGIAFNWEHTTKQAKSFTR